MEKQSRRKCLICRAWFHPKFSNEWWCCPEHGAELAIKRRSREREKAEAKLKKDQQQKKREEKCAPCNNHLSGNIENYTPHLIEKIGQDRFDRLMGVHELPKWKRDDYERIRDEYRRKLKELKNAT